MEFRGKSVVITGGASGIGLAITQAMIKAGAFVTITGRDLRKLEAVASNQPSIKGRACDVIDDAAVVAFRDELVAEGGIDVLINNAGVMEFFNVLDGYPLENRSG